jgi:hypothetical protein
VKAHSILCQAAHHLQNRAKEYDKPEGERSMGKTVAMFNILHGDTIAKTGALTETMGWQMQVLLKMVRSTTGEFKADTHEDATAYSALAGESAAAEHAAKQAKVVSITTAMKNAVEKKHAHDRTGRAATRNRGKTLIQAAPRKRGAR